MRRRGGADRSSELTSRSFRIRDEGAVRVNDVAREVIDGAGDELGVHSMIAAERADRILLVLADELKRISPPIGTRQMPDVLRLQHAAEIFVRDSAVLH